MGWHMGLILILAIALNVVSLAVIFKQENRFLSGSIGMAVCLLMSGLTAHYFLAENPFNLTQSGLSSSIATSVSCLVYNLFNRADFTFACACRNCCGDLFLFEDEGERFVRRNE
ncbi:hypothetical protein JCM19045_4344 [Bacillus sp. JCM 19045]|nr:hypothetical protein JCM19045_4344 [Bacillus sp. JCM 19045]